MRHVAATARIAGLIFVALASVGAGAMLLWGWLDPETLAAAHTVELLCVLALLFLPVVTVVLAELDRRSRPRSARRAGAASSPTASSSNRPCTAPPPGEPRRAAIARDARRHAPHAHPAGHAEPKAPRGQPAQRPAPDRSSRARSHAPASE